MDPFTVIFLDRETVENHIYQVMAETAPAAVEAAYREYSLLFPSDEQAEMLQFAADMLTPVTIFHGFMPPVALSISDELEIAAIRERLAPKS